METTIKRISKRFEFHSRFQKMVKLWRMSRKRSIEEQLEQALSEDISDFSIEKLHYLSTLCFDSKLHSQRGIGLTEEALKRKPNNFNALWNQARIRISEKELDPDSYTKLEDALMAASNNRLHMLVADMEITKICDKFFLLPSKREYSRILSIAQAIQYFFGNSLETHNTITSVKLALSKKYFQDLISFPKQSIKQKHAFQEAKKLLKDIIKTADSDEGEDEQTATLHKVKAMMQLAKMMFEYLKNSRQANTIRFGDRDYDLLENDISFYFQEAIHMISETSIFPSIKKSRMLWFYGMFLEDCAKVKSEEGYKTVDDWQKTLDIYHKAADTNPEDHRILHKIADVCRTCWAIEEGHSDKLTVVMNQDRKWMDNSHKSNRRVRVVMPPTEIVSQTDIPSPYKMVGFYRLMISFNFRARDVENKYLIKSLDYFGKASDLAKHENRFHLLHLGRTWQSFGDDEKALHYFSEARETSDTMMSGGSLHEQWAMLIDRLVSSSDYRGDQTRERALQYYREALRYQVLFGTSSMVALYYFSKLLFKLTQMEDYKCDAILQKEYYLIYMVIQDSKTDKVPLYIAPEFKGDKIKTWIAWNLIEMLYERNKNDDAATALMYLFILDEAGMIEDQPKQGNITKVDTKLEKSKLVFEISKRAVKPCFLPKYIIVNTYGWLQDLTKFDGEILNPRLCLLGTSFTDPDVENVWRILKHCQFRITDVCTDEYEITEVVPHRLRKQLFYILHRVKKIVIVYNPGRNQDQLLKVINLILTNRRLMPNRVCVATSDDSGPTITLSGVDLPVWNIRDVDHTGKVQDTAANTELKTAREVHFYSLMEALFFGQFNWIRRAKHSKTMIYERVPKVLTSV